MTEATAPLPEALILEEEVRRLTSIVAALNATVAAGNAEVARFADAIEQAVKVGLSVDPVAWEAVRRVGDRQGEARQHAEAAREQAGLVRRVGDKATTMQTLQEERQRRQAALAPVPEPVPRKRRRHASGQHRGLKIVPGFLAPLAAFLRHAMPAAKFTPVVKAGLITAGVVGTTAVAGTVYVAAHTLNPPAHPSGSAAASPNPVASIFSAAPIGQRTPGGGIDIDLLTKPTTDAKTARGVTPSLVPPSWTPPSFQSPNSPTSPQSYQSPQSQAPQQSQQSPPVLQVTGADQNGNIDLTSGPVTLVLSASGGTGGWVAWKVDTHGAGDLDFSKTEGVLVAGETVTVTVSVDAAQSVDGNPSETFSVGGTSVTATLPPPSVPSPAATPTTPAPASS